MKKFVVVRLLTLLIAASAMGACTSVGSLGLVTKPAADPSAILKSGKHYQELGPASGEACRYFLLAIVPSGDSAFSTAVNNALKDNGGDALINVTVSSSLYGFIPIYNVFTYTCTTVSGIAVKFENP